MSERNRMGDYAIKKLGAGAETDVYKPKKQAANARDKGVVIKDFARLSGDLHPEDTKWVRGENGFDDAVKLRLQENYRGLRATYGDMIARARFIKNPDNPELNLLVQEYIALADPARVDEYYPADIDDDQLRSKLTDFVVALKQNYILAAEHKSHVIPDLAGDNLVFSQNLDRIVYIDLGLEELNYINIDTLLIIARLAILGGAKAADLSQDKFYAKLYHSFPELKGIDDTDDYYQALLDLEQQGVRGEFGK